MDTSIEKEAWPVGTKIQHEGSDGIHHSTVIARTYIKSLGGNIIPVYVCQYVWDDIEEIVYEDGQVCGVGLHFLQVGFEQSCGYEALKEEV